MNSVSTLKSTECNGNYTKIIITNSNNYLPSDLAINAYSFSLPISLKETCFGIVITGTKEDINFISQKIQQLDKNYIFIKSRGFPTGDKRRCRARRNGGSRPGFYTLYEEIKILSYISKALEKYDYNISNSIIKEYISEKKIIKPNYILELGK